MKVKDLKEAVNGINMDDEMQKKIIRNVKLHTDKNAGREKRRDLKVPKWKKPAAAVIVAAVLGVAAFPVRAFVNSLVQERMEGMAEEEITFIAENVGKQTTEADSYSRDYTAEEKERYQELYQQYKDGTFPEGELLQVDSEEEASQHEFCFLTTAAHFYLPERELTDEELLEIIDFILKREYSYNQHYEEEHAEEAARGKEEEKEGIAANAESGGITERQAIETAERLLADFYGITGEGMEMDHYYDGKNEGMDPGTESYYCVSWSDIIAHQYYYLFISAKDGHLIMATHSGSDIAEAEGVAAEAAESKIPALHEQAAAFMEEKIKDGYQKEYVYYLAYENGTTTGYARFIFEKEDGHAYEVSYLWNGTFFSIKEADISDYEDGKTVSKSAGEGKEELKTIFRQL